MWSMYQYQLLSFERKRLNDPDTTDTPGSDWKYTMAGYLAVCGWCVL